MKRLIIGLISALLMTVGLVGASQVPASACPYTGCVSTNTRVTVPNAPVKKGTRAKVCVRVTTPGSGVPKGRVTATVKGTNGWMWSATKKYRGGQVCFTSRKIKRVGTYSARGIFSPFSSSPFGSSRGSTSFQVR